MKTNPFKDEFKEFLLLVRHFLLRLFQNDIMKFENQRRENLVLLLTFFSIAGCLGAGVILFPYLRSQPGYTSETVWVEKTFFMTICMAFTGIIAVLNWDNMFMDEKDFLNLSVLPVKTSTLFTAKFFSLLVFAGLLSLSLNLFPILIFTFFLGDIINVDPFFRVSMLQFGIVHIISSFLANLFVFMLVAFIQGILMIILNTRLFKKMSIVFQTLLLAGFISCFTWFPRVAPHLITMKEKNPTFFYYFPPAWFVGFYEQLIGNYDILFKNLLYIAPVAVTLLVDAYILMIPHGFNRFSRPVSGTRPVTFFPGAAEWLKKHFHAVFLKHALQRAVFYFVVSTRRRSRKHKFQLAVYIIFPLAFIITELIARSLDSGIQFFQETNFFMCSIPFILYFFLVWGIRVVVMHPVSVDASWAFLIAEGDYPVHYIWGLKKAAIVIGILFCFIPLLLFYSVCWGFIPGLLYSLYSGITAFLLLELFFFSYSKLPFVSAYIPGKFLMKYIWPLYLMIFTLFVYLFTRIGIYLITFPAAYFFYYGAAATDIYWVRRLRYKRYRGFRFVFDEEPEPVMTGLGFDAE